MLYFSLSVLTTFSEKFATYVAKSNPPELTWADWTITGCAAAISGMIALRGYFDGTHSRVLSDMDTKEQQ